MGMLGEVKRSASSNVFITGALGFLGKFFVRELLEKNPELHLYLLVRGNDKASPEDRVRMAGLLHPNVTVVPGDVTDPDLAEKLCGRISSCPIGEGRASARPGRAEARPSRSGHTEARPSRSGHTEARPSRSGHAEARPSRSGHAEARPSRSPSRR